MRQFTSRIALAIFLFSASHAPAEAGESTATLAPSIRRFDRVDARLYRGAQPDAAGFEALKRLGIKTVVNLRQNDSERATVEALGMRYVSLSTGLAPFGLDGGMDEGIVRGFFAVMDDEASGPVFVHCRRGADRTGTLVAMYRIARQGWTAKAAYDEARSIGMRWWYFNIKGQLEAFESGVRPAASRVALAPAIP
jgi:protein tyrosine/serine phosphatase